MKIASFFTATACFALLFAGLSMAQGQRGDKPTEKERLAQFLERFPQSDANQDGVLSMEEVRVYNQKRRQSEKDQPARSEPRQPAKSKPTHANVPYGDHERQVFDLWLTESSDGKATPLVIYIHGGGFRGGNKNSFSPASLKAFQDNGLSFAAIHYRLSDTGPYPIMMEDAARCLQAIRSRAKEWNLDAERVACYGGSAGAGISLWLGFHEDLADPDSSDLIARQSTRITAAGTTNGQSTYDMRTFREWFKIPDLPPHPALEAFYAVEKGGSWETSRVKRLMTEASAISHLSKDDVPVYMTYNRGDVPVDRDTNPSVWVHHVRLGLKLQKAMRVIGLECQVTSPDLKEEAYGSLDAFLIAKLKE